MIMYMLYLYCRVLYVLDRTGTYCREHPHNVALSALLHYFCWLIFPRL